MLWERQFRPNALYARPWSGGDWTRFLCPTCAAPASSPLGQMTYGTGARPVVHFLAGTPPLCPFFHTVAVNIIHGGTMYPHFIAPGEVYQEYGRRVADADRKYQRATAVQRRNPQFDSEPRGRVWLRIRAWLTAARQRRPVEEGSRA